MDLSQILENYDPQNLTIASLGGHSALDVCEGAKKHGFKTLVIARKGREKTYEKYYKTRQDKITGKTIGCVDETITLDKFSDVLSEDVQNELRKRNAIFIHNRYFWVYFDDFNQVEQNFKVPIYGTREMLKLEERDVEKNQYYLMEKAGIRFPKIYDSPESIDKLCIVKVNEATRSYERAFFLAESPQEYKIKGDEMIKNGTITAESLKNAVIEEYAIGAHVNFNYFYSPLTDQLELMGTDMRRQTDLDGYLRMPASVQMEILDHKEPKMIETGHVTCTTKESLLEKIFEIGEKFVKTSKEECSPGIIGPFALQGAIIAEEGKEDAVIFDVSMRIPGSPGTRFTPSTSYLYSKPMSYGERIALELKYAIKENKLSEILT
ncbi:DUF1297 domain-containing protein [Patescibacteria group bacterium]|nr:DUF1297 domain-containing protein [Patescibacteria group bacterium]